MKILGWLWLYEHHLGWIIPLVSICGALWLVGFIMRDRP